MAGKAPKGAGTSDGPAQPINAEQSAEFEKAIKQGRELETSEDLPPDQRNKLEDQVPGIKFLASLIKATIFTDLFVYHADVRFVHPTSQERVDALISAHPVFYKVCRNADLVARAVLMTITVSLAALAAWGTIYKLFFA